MELGGSDAYLVLSDSDLDTAARAVVDARAANSGQTCIAPKRCIVEKGVREAFERKVVALAKRKAERHGAILGIKSNEKQ